MKMYEIFSPESGRSYGYHTMDKIMAGFGRRRFRHEKFEMSVTDDEVGIIGFIDPDTGEFLED